MKKVIITVVVICSILLGGCNKIEVIESEQEVIVSYKTLFAELQNEIIVSVTEKTELESDALALMIDGGASDLTVSVGYPKDSKIDATLIQQIVEDSINNISEKDTTSEERVKITIKIEKY
ncbi:MULTISPECIES: topoisomerase [Solibacillus]|uniref:topoisomerase n=1 Tax=Solibacillus TaxID=648800 RepID=UPI0020415559|nr:topoisomerase [Solibacillus isronensis]MCM3721531.1 topoisomerase [Solibacillus isronensis]